MPQNITLEQVKQACREAYAKRRLIAQTPLTLLQYHTSHGFVCAIGAAMSKATLKAIGNNQDGAFSEGFLICPSNERDAIYNIQNAHDAWAKFKTPYLESYFVSLIN